MDFSETINAKLSGATVRAALLAEFQFASGTQRVWPGYGTLTVGGHDWRGVGKFANVDGLSDRLDMAAQPMKFTLSGVDPNLVSIVKNSAAEVKNRACIVYLQFFDDAWKPLDTPFAIRTAIMDQMQYEADGPATRIITLTAEGIFAARQAAPFAYCTDRDQQRRFAGDGFFKLAPSLIVKQITWPP